jgi:hypothetical protein
MPLKSWLFGSNKKKGPLAIEASENGALAMIEQEGLFENFFHERTTVTTGSPKSYNASDLIKRACTSGYISNDSSTDELEVKINDQKDLIWIEHNESLDLTYSNARTIIISSSGTSVPFRIFLK